MVSFADAGPPLQSELLQFGSKAFCPLQEYDPTTVSSGGGGQPYAPGIGAGVGYGSFVHAEPVGVAVAPAEGVAVGVGVGVAPGEGVVLGVGVGVGAIAGGITPSG